MAKRTEIVVVHKNMKEQKLCQQKVSLSYVEETAYRSFLGKKTQQTPSRVSQITQPLLWMSLIQEIQLVDFKLL